MIFINWIEEFCVIHKKYQLLYSVLESKRLLDLFDTIKDFIKLPKRSIETYYCVYETYYDNHGKRQGTCRSWYPDGKIRSISNYNNDKLQGNYCDYYQNGQIERDENFNNGDYENVCRVWHPNGQLRSMQFFIDGRRYGSFKTWDPNGKLVLDYFYDNDEISPRQNNSTHLSPTTLIS